LIGVALFSVLWRVRLVIHPVRSKPKGFHVGCAAKARRRDQLYQRVHEQMCQKTGNNNIWYVFSPELRYKIRISKYFNG